MNVNNGNYNTTNNHNNNNNRNTNNNKNNKNNNTNNKNKNKNKNKINHGGHNVKIGKNINSGHATSTNLKHQMNVMVDENDSKNEQIENIENNEAGSKTTLSPAVTATPPTGVLPLSTKVTDTNTNINNSNNNNNNNIITNNGNMNTINNNGKNDDSKQNEKVNNDDSVAGESDGDPNQIQLTIEDLDGSECNDPGLSMDIGNVDVSDDDSGTGTRSPTDIAPEIGQTGLGMGVNSQGGKYGLNGMPVGPNGNQMIVNGHVIQTPKDSTHDKGSNTMEDWSVYIFQFVFTFFIFMSNVLLLLCCVMVANLCLVHC